MSKKRGLSLDEKRSRLLEVFHETGEVFVLKEVEKLGTKKGITPQSIKDVLQSLVDDDLVHQEKIGSANYFWSFPSEASRLVEVEMEKTQQRLNATRLKSTEVQASLEAQQVGREDSSERQEKQLQVTQLRDTVARLESELRIYSDSDPETLAKVHEATQVAKAAANRWLDNLLSLQSWCCKQFRGMEHEVKALFQQNGIHDDLDYID